MSAVDAFDDGGGFSAVDTVDDIFEGGRFQCFFALVKEVVDVLLGVLLDGDVYGVATLPFVGVAVFFGIVVFSIGEFKVSEHFLELVEHVVIHVSDFGSIDHVWLLAV